MFRRSFERHGLRYTTFFFMETEGPIDALTEDAVYGFVEIEKKDCLNRVHKRIGSALHTLVDMKKAQGKALECKGRLTQDRIKRIANYYGYALRNHSHDVPAMQRAVQATFQNMSTTDESPNHSFCPKGANSWCSYNRASVNSEQPRGHKNALPDFVREALEPVFTRLSDEDLLERCSDGKRRTQITLVEKQKADLLFSGITKFTELGSELRSLDQCADTSSFQVKPEGNPESLPSQIVRDAFRRAEKQQMLRMACHHAWTAILARAVAPAIVRHQDLPKAMEASLRKALEKSHCST
ncbi:hypothetical protein ISCGN_032924 [Ixodes scapularis]